MAFALCHLADVGALAQGPLGVVAAGGSTLSSELVGTATGALSQAQVFDGPFNLVASDPAGRVVYAAAGTTLYAGTIDSGTGILTPIAGFPYTLPGAITALTVEARGRFLYVGSSGDVQAARIDPATGALTLIAGSPFNVGINIPGCISQRLSQRRSRGVSVCRWSYQHRAFFSEQPGYGGDVD